VVFNITREAGRCDSFATEENESGVSVTVRRVESGKQKSRSYLTPALSLLLSRAGEGVFSASRLRSQDGAHLIRPAAIFSP
jgi:hypothetical protein